MPEIYTKIHDLFTLPGVLNVDMQASANGAAPFTEKLLMTQYSDGRIEIDGSFYIELGQSINAGDTLIDLSKVPLFPSFDAPNTSFIITVVAGPNVLIGASVYLASLTRIDFLNTSDVGSLALTAQYYIRGTLVPQNVRSLQVNQFGG